MDRFIDIETIEVEVDYDDPEYLDPEYPWHEELDFNKDVVTEYLPEGEDDYEEEVYDD